MYEMFYIFGIVFLILTVGFLIASISVFIGCHVSVLWKEINGTLKMQQIAEIRNVSRTAARSRINVFEDLEKKAKIKKGYTGSLTNQSASLAPKMQETPANPVPVQTASDPGTTVLQSNAPVNSSFIIEKNIMFVSTREVI